MLPCCCSPPDPTGDEVGRLTWAPLHAGSGPGDPARISSGLIAGRWAPQGSVYAKCMAVKTITIDLEAYERLSRLKKGDSFSQVIKKYLPAPGSTAADLLAALDSAEVSTETLDAIDDAVADRRQHPVRVPRW